MERGAKVLATGTTRPGAAMRRLLLAWLVALPCAGAAENEFPCVIEPSRVVKASTAVEGILESVEVEKGDRVEKGQIVAVLESEVERASVEQAEARVNLTAALDARKAVVDRARSKYRRAQDLSKKKYVSPDELDELQSELVIAELDLQAERERLELARLELKRVRALHDQRFIKSPISGLVTERLLSAGEFAQAQAILTLAQLNPLYVEVVLPSTFYGRVKEGMVATSYPAAPVGGEFEARVTLVEQVIDAASATFGVRLELPNPDYRLPAGLECRVRFPL
jgi:RND family efflux transporter MFP subunit